MTLRVRPAVEADLEAVVASETDNLGVDAWSPALVVPGVRGEVPHAHYLVADLAGADQRHAGNGKSGNACRALAQQF